MNTVTAEDVNTFWIYEIGPGGWYEVDEAVDEAIRSRFMPAWRLAAAGALDNWMMRPDSALALLILLDQFPRNMFRGAESAFSSDAKALAVAKKALTAGFDLRVREPERQFFYLPLMHSESITDQDRCVRLIMTRMPKLGAEHLRFAREHRDVIRRFGRFPKRNKALGRCSTRAEELYLGDHSTAA